MTVRKPASPALAGLTILDAIDAPNLLGAAIRDPESWKPWRAFLAAIFGLPLDEYGLDLFRACTGLPESPTAACDIAWLVIGRRGGKSFAMAVAAVFIACFRN